MVEVIVTDEFTAWYDELSVDHQEAVAHSVGLLEAMGVSLRFPHTSEIKGSRYAIRELRVKAGNAAIRALYAFDPKRQAVMLLGGDKKGDDRFYEREVPRAEKIWEDYLAGK